MAWTKRQLVMQAFEDAGMASYVFDLTPEDLDSGLRKLDAMMATWTARGINIGYTSADSADGSDLDQDSGIPAIAVEATTANLAKRIAAYYGKAVPASTLESAKTSLDALMQSLAYPREIPYSGLMPRGAGNRRFAGVTHRFFSRPNTSPILQDSNGETNLGD